MDTGGWRATVYRVAQSQTQRKQLSMSSLAFHMMYSAYKLNKQGEIYNLETLLSQFRTSALFHVRF